MIRATTEEPRYLTKFTNGTGAAFADASPEQGGTGTSFRPHELLEAALATCVNVTLRMYAERHGVPLEDVATEVRMDSSSPDQTIFRYEIELYGNALTDEDRAKLVEIARSCNVQRALSKPIRFESAAENTHTPTAVRSAASWQS